MPWPGHAEAARLRAAAPALLLIVLVAVVAVLTPGARTLGAALETLTDTATLFVLAAGVTFVIMLGGIDLSIQSVASMSSVVLAMALPRFGVFSFALALLVGAAAGLFSGLVHVRLKVPSFIATLATGGVMSGLALVASGARSVTIREAGRARLDWINGSLLGVPTLIWCGLAVLLLGLAIQIYTPFGRYSTAIGAGEPAAWASGVKVDRHKLIAFVLSATLAALAGIFLAARMSSGSPTLANQLLLPAIAAVVVGGTAITGGVGGVGRTLIGALTISVVRLGMTFLNVDIFAQQIVFGTVLVLSVAATIDRSKIPIVK
jgi:ribose transport system permease protein